MPREVIRRILKLSCLVLPFFVLPTRVSAAWDPAGESLGPVHCQGNYAACEDGAGGEYTFWYRESAPVGIVGHRRTPDGSTAPGWAASGTVLVSASLPFENMDAVPDGSGGAYLMYHSSLLGAPDKQIRVLHIRADATLDPAWPVGGALVGTADHAKWATLTADAHGGAYVTWYELLDFMPATFPIRGRYDAHVARLGADGAPAPGWQSVGVTFAPLAPESLFSELRTGLLASVGDTSGIAVAWSDSSDGDDQVRLWRIASTGAVHAAWPAQGVALSGVTRLGGFAAGRSGDLYASWAERIAGLPQARLAHLNATGGTAAGWPVAGLSLHPSGADFSGGSELAVDAAGGVYAMIDAGVLSGATLDLQIHRRTAAGSLVPGFPPNGVAIRDTNSGSMYPATIRLLDDAHGGVFALWLRGTDRALMALRVQGDGSLPPGWDLAAPRLVEPNPGSWAKANVNPVGVCHAITQHHVSEFACELRSYRIGPDGTPLANVPVASRSSDIRLAAGPNPSHGEVAISLTLPRMAKVRVSVLDANGRRVRALHTAPLAAGTHTLAWDGRDASGSEVSPGLYFISLESEGSRVTRRLVQMR